MSKTQKYGFLLLGILLLVGLRIVLWFSYGKTPIPTSPFSDPLVYRDLATAWAESGNMPNSAVFHPPLYPYLLGVVFRLFHQSSYAMILIQNAMGVVTGGAILAAILWSGASLRIFFFVLFLLLQGGAWLLFEWRLYPESFAIDFQILMVLGLWWLVADDRLAKDPFPRNIVLFSCAFLFGALVCLRPNFILAVPFIAGWFFMPSNRSRLGRLSGLYFLIVPMLFCLPIMSRNHMLGAGFTLAANSGITFLQGNSPEANGLYTQVPGVSPDILRQNEDAMRIATRQGAANIAAANSFWFRKGIDWWIDHPLKGIRLAITKAFLFFSPTELGGDMPVNFERARVPFLRWTSLVNFLLISFLTLFSWKALRKFRFPVIPAAVLAGSAFATCVIFYMNNRYRATVWPLFVIAAAFGFDHILREWSRKSKRKRGEDPRFIFGFSILIGAALFFFNLPNDLSDSDLLTGWHNWGVSNSRIQNFEEAERAYSRVLEIYPGHIPTLENLSFVKIRQKKYAEARTTLEQLLKIDPKSYLGSLRMAEVRIKQGYMDDAIVYANMALKVRPNDFGATEKLAEALFMKADREKACPLLTELVQRAPSLGQSVDGSILELYQICENLKRREKETNPRSPKDNLAERKSAELIVR